MAQASRGAHFGAKCLRTQAKTQHVALFGASEGFGACMAAFDRRPLSLFGVRQRLDRLASLLFNAYVAA